MEQARLSVSENVVRLRAQLEENTPCPVCGSQSHPYAAHHPLADGLLETLEKEVRQHEAAYNRLKTENARLEAEHRYLGDKMKNMNRKKNAKRFASKSRSLIRIGLFLTDKIG